MKRSIVILIAILAGIVLIFSACGNEAEDLQQLHQEAEEQYLDQFGEP